MKTKKILALALAAVLLVAVSVAGTMAYLKAETTKITNTFVPTTLSVGVAETTSDYTMIPGATIAKNPKVSYTTEVDAWLFVEITENSNLKDFITYGIAEGWTSVQNTTNVYYREVAANSNEGPFSVLTNDQVTVNADVTKADMDGLKNGAAAPTLSFQAYIIQKEGFANPELAWAEVK